MMSTHEVRELKIGQQLVYRPDSPQQQYAEVAHPPVELTDGDVAIAVRWRMRGSYVRTSLVSIVRSSRDGRNHLTGYPDWEVL